MPATSKLRIVFNLVLVMLVSAPAVAIDFRIDTGVFGKDEQQPLSENLTLFADGVVYDFMLTEPREIVIFNPAEQDFTLLDVGRRVRLTLTKNEIVQMNAELRELGRESKDPGLFDTDFKVSFDLDDQWLKLSGDRITYKVRGKSARSPEAVAIYRQFADWYARLNATRPGSIPPFARLELNKAIAAHGLIPEEVRLEISPKNRLFGKTFRASSKHLVLWQLSEQDRAKIEAAHHYRATFKEVSFQEYRQLSGVASRDR